MSVIRDIVFLGVAGACLVTVVIPEVAGDVLRRAVDPEMAARFTLDKTRIIAAAVLFAITYIVNSWRDQ